MWTYVHTDELYHHGIKGMKWGRRRWQNKDGSLTPAGRQRYGDDDGVYKKAVKKFTNSKIGSKYKLKDDPEDELREVEGKPPKERTPEEKAARRKKALKIGAAVVGTALATYGAYKLAAYTQNKRNTAAMQKAQDYISKNAYQKIGESTFGDGTRRMYFKSDTYGELVTGGSRGNIGKAVGKHNARVVAQGRQMYRDATNTRLDRGLAKVVKTGDAVENAAKRAAAPVVNAAKSAGNKAKNAVLDVVNPIYEYTPGDTRTVTRDYGNGIKYTEQVTDYIKRKKKR